MTDVACFCGCLYSFDGDAGACPRCGKYATVRTGPALTRAEGGQPREERDFGRWSGQRPNRARTRPVSAVAPVTGRKRSDAVWRA
jgi:hypothetical protein